MVLMLETQDILRDSWLEAARKQNKSDKDES